MAADELLASEPVEAAFFSLSPLKRWSRLRAARFRERMRGARVPFRVLERASDLGSLRHPAAVFAVNDMAAAALLRHAAECGIQCPRDFTLVSVDNAAWVLFARENGLTSFDEMLPEAYRPGLSCRHAQCAAIPLF